MKGTPDYWVEIRYHDGSVAYRPKLGSLAQAYDYCKGVVQQNDRQGVDFVVLLDGDYVPGTVALNRQIRGDWQGYYVPGAMRAA